MTAAPVTTSRDQYPAAGAWQLDPTHTSVEFVARHMMVTKVRGRFDSFTGTIEVGDDVLDSKLDIQLDVASLTTGSADRDGHLHSNDFFLVEEYPTIDFTSTAIEPVGDHWKVTGDLTVRGVTRPVELDLSYEGLVQDPWGGTRAGFSLTGEIDREDWGLTWNVALEGGGILVSKKIKIEIETQITPAG